MSAHLREVWSALRHESMPWIEGPDSSDRCTETVLNQFGIFGKAPKTGRGVMGLLERAGWKLRMPSDGSAAGKTVKGFYEAHPHGRYYIATEDHAMALVDGLLVDAAGKGPDDRPILGALEVYR